MHTRRLSTQLINNVPLITSVNFPVNSYKLLFTYISSMATVFLVYLRVKVEKRGNVICIVNPVMHMSQNGQTLYKNLAVDDGRTLSVLGYFEILCIKWLIAVNVFIYRCTQKKKSPIKDFFSKCDQIRSFLLIWSHWLRKSLMKNIYFFCNLFCVRHRFRNLYVEKMAIGRGGSEKMGYANLELYLLKHCNFL